MEILIFFLAISVGTISALPQEFKTKGGHGDVFEYNPNDNIVRFYEQNNTYHQNGTMRFNLSKPIDFEKGVCYIEVPTASLVRDPTHVPAGNGSRPDLSRVRSCCKGYIRNIHNFKICDPVCTRECVNGLCTAPEVCTCFPDHVRNLAGYCVPTCPIGCQHGECIDGTCVCKTGYKFGPKENKFCVPSCQGNCGGVGNCTEPNVCDCPKGYEATPEGSCEVGCGKCEDGYCKGTECVCREGFKKNEIGECVVYCPNCGKGAVCLSPGNCVCSYPLEKDEVTGDCVPKCDLPCINGICSGANVCSCNHGYAPDTSDRTGTRCIPHCQGGCANGICSAPNFCICNSGFVKDRSIKGSQKCVRRVRRSAIPDVQLLEADKVDVAKLLVFDIPEEDYSF